MRQIPLRARNGDVRAYALVDAEDYERIAQFRWCLNGKGYAHRLVYRSNPRRQRHELMHRAILRQPWGGDLQVDHINRNKLDNRRSNLRLVTPAQQRQNVDSYKGSGSRFRGVTFVGGSWRACLRINKELVVLGQFESEIEAAEVARRGRLSLMSHAVD